MCFDVCDNQNELYYYMSSIGHQYANSLIVLRLRFISMASVRIYLHMCCTSYSEVPYYSGTPKCGLPEIRIP